MRMDFIYCKVIWQTGHPAYQYWFRPERLFRLSLLDISIIPETYSGFEKFLFGIFILTLLTLWSFIDIVGHFIAIHLIDNRRNAKWIDKDPKLENILNYFRKTNYIFLTVEILFVLSIYLMVIGICVSILYFNLKKSFPYSR